ncbi:hypothetical protein [Serpentinicella alkaliphila]|uniref:Uncharacterized protein n=1 Tax=Serpentinicella alkaliphila TaxID=1734049 RepID=A0A4R2TKM1_9FIRM|nr:hypothetical protein [Serpentinicella alkaliphila]QUH24466.1 hypothetical protein HZR23_00740 [Serpentinicella alkaliphila]TCQ04138.1 hypothetical protein EDD79_100716 [Serpentinicella alkaliphila]
MSIRKSQWTNINGHRVELSSRTYKFEDRHFHREIKSQEAQLQNHDAGYRKNIKTPMDNKLT